MILGSEGTYLLRGDGEIGYLSRCGNVARIDHELDFLTDIS